MEKKATKKTPRKYDSEFKAQVLTMIQSGLSVAEVSRRMGIGENLLYKWKSEEKARQSPAQLEENQELEQLRKQLRQVEMERDILEPMHT